MKIILLFLTAILLSSHSMAASKQRFLIINGKAELTKAKELQLLYAEDGMWKVHSTVALNESKNFEFAVANPKKGIWAITEQPKTGILSYNIIFCVQDSEELTLHIGNAIYEYTMEGKLSKNNKILNEWNKLTLDIFSIPRPTFDKVFPRLDEYFKRAEELAKEIKSKDKMFDEFLRSYILTDAKYQALHYNLQPNTKFPKPEERHPFYAEIESFKLDKDCYANMPFTTSLPQMLEANYIINHGQDGYDNYATSLWTSATDKVKGVIFYGKVKQGFYNRKTYDHFYADYQKYASCLYTEEQKLAVEKYRDENITLGSGQPAIDFCFPDKDGNRIALSDFKGKVVVVDVWATWCGPCMLEVPHMNKLEKEYANNDNVVFISVSTDKESSKSTWLATIKKHQMGGYQLWADDASKIKEPYKINSIPRFMVFDKEGKIVSTNAPRPSDPALKDIIENTLNNNNKKQ